jgi:drug/metabolite transporter (DMT)-like permease
MKNPRALAHLLLLATVFVWGATFVLVKNALNDSSPLLFNLMRMALATLALVAINFQHLRHVTRAVAGVFLAAGYQFQTMGLTQTTPAKSAFLTGLVVVFVPALTLIPAFRPAGTKAPGVSTAVGAMLAFAGLILITTPPGTVLRHLFVSIGAGDLMTLACAVAFAAHLLTLARVSKGIAAGVLATLQIGFCTAAMLITLPLERPHVNFTPRLWITLAICSLFATAAAFTIQSFAQQVLPPTHTVVLLALEPVFAWITGIVVLHDSLDRRSMMGAGLILVGIVVIEILHTTHTTEIPA